MPRPHRLVLPRRTQDGRFVFGDLTLTAEQLIAACPADGDPVRARRFTLIRDGWRIADFHLFRPLVYFTAFGEDETFAMLDIALRSLASMGQWRWDIAILTEPWRVDALRQSLDPKGFGLRPHVLPCSPCADAVDWCQARYRVTEHALFEYYQPILYLDVDVACDRPLEALLAELLLSHLMHCNAEGRLDEGVAETDGQWFGLPLLRADKVPADPLSPGFSDGVIGFRDMAHAAGVFRLVLESASGYARMASQRQPFAGRSQPYAGYVFRKLGVVEMSLITRFLRLHRIDPDDPRIPDPAGARGLVHFLHAPYPIRASVMRRYLEVTCRHRVVRVES